MSRVVARVVEGMIAVALLAGCSSGGQKPPGLTTSPTPVVQTTSPTPTGESVIDRTDPKLGIVFTKMPDVTGDLASALNGLSLYEVGAWRSTTTGKVDPMLLLIASPGVQAMVQGQVDGNTARAATIHGTQTVTIGITTAGAGTAVGTACEDPSGVMFTNADGTFTAAEGGIVDKYFFDVSLSRSNGAGPWVVDAYKRNGTC